MRTEGTMKVVVFESHANKPLAERTADLLGEATEWLRSRAIMEVSVGPKKKGKWAASHITITLGELVDYDENIEANNSTLQLFLFHDDNEKG